MTSSNQMLVVFYSDRRGAVRNDGILRALVRTAGWYINIQVRHSETHSSVSESSNCLTMWLLLRKLGKMNQYFECRITAD